MPDGSRIANSVCPHECPSACALDIDLLEDGTVGRVHGTKDHSYTKGVVCAKVARYAERLYHPDRLLSPLCRTGPKGSGQFQTITWDDALDEVAEEFLKAEQKWGAETVWPYYYAGTMGLVMRDGINRLRNVKKYSGQYSTICVTLAWTGFIAGTGKLAGSDPREMAKSDVVVIWGTNPVNTQINVMSHVVKAQKDRGAKLVVIDTYQTETAKKADHFLCVRPGTDGALACAIMHVLFRDGYADREYLEQYTDAPQELESHLQGKTPEWASEICGLRADEITDLARLIGNNKRTFLRLGYGFTRSRNGAVNMHAALSIAAVTGAWQHEGGGGFHNNGAIYGLNKTMIEGLDSLDPTVRVLDQSRIGAVLTGDKRDLGDGPPVTALLVQNTNPMEVAPDLSKVHKGFAREDLFTCVHEQFMTDTAKMADIILPATMFLEHDDIYQGGGHQHIMIGPKAVEPPEQCRTNHQVITALASRLGAEHPGFQMSPLEIADWTLTSSGRPSVSELKETKWIDCQPDFNEAHYIDGFAHADGKFHFKANWQSLLGVEAVTSDSAHAMPELPDHWDSIDSATNEKPFRLVTAPARNFLNSTFTETPTSKSKESRPRLKINPDDARQLGVTDNQTVRLGNDRGSLLIEAELFDGVGRGVLIVESIWPNAAFREGIGINVLTGADPVAPIGGAAFHDTAVWIRKA